MATSPLLGAPGMGALSWVKVPKPPGSGKAIARTKGVHREMESEGRSRQISGLTNRNHIRLVMGIRPPNRLKSHSYTEP